ncbi:TetR/AcrR family transcriptional regulator [Gammaproteobacteria bacterium]|nr:TetR/AcrR family transcriptional regulator [Gammaproteobacteria bacterium]MDB3902189.1 TetR/AcrR family transcriptional regulator [bacterium]MDA9131541.1 TetR/AcrR family transcriptional regulator [Gammaproteobacteria bacterium]MDA9142553.1 TetR/AcrR family transcriptional regulator [Gammaproteobacteria bacterium]MDA9249052.1 TetR/AcrR family transcriptional regulator [Gammaproteobacteria bacterium]
MKYHHGNLKEELISSACIVCEADGHDRMSLRSIAKEAKVSQTAPYRHFKTKESLLAEVSTRGFTELKEILQNANAKKTLSTRDRFLEMGQTYIEFGLSKRNTYDLMHSPVIDKTQFPELLNSAVGAFEELVCVLAELNPGISAKDLDIKCIHYWALVHGLVGLLRNDSLAESEIDTKAGNAMGLVKSDLRSFLISALEF